VSRKNRKYNESGFFFNAEFLGRNRMLFENVDQYILMGGNVDKCFRLALTSLVAAKFPGMMLFIGTGKYYKIADEQSAPVNELGIKHSRHIKVHFNAEACFAHKISNTAYGAQVTFNDLLRDNRGDCEPRSPEEICLMLINMNRYIFSSVGLRVNEVINGEPGESFGTTDENAPSMTLYYWKDIRSMEKFLCAH
jgi:hypothetical protein